MAKINQPKTIRIYGGSTKKELNPDMFDGFVMKRSIQRLLKIISRKFEDFLDFEQRPVHVKVVGSSINYNWTVDSDIDLHLVYDFNSFSQCPDEETIRKLVLTAKTLFNLKHDIKVLGMDVELYVEDINDENKSSAVYSLTDNRWIKKPVYVDPEIKKNYIISQVKYYMNFIDRLEQMPIGTDRLDASIKLKDKIMNVRKTGLMNKGEFDEENLVFKTLRNHRYLEKLASIILETEDSLLSYEKPDVK